MKRTIVVGAICALLGATAVAVAQKGGSPTTGPMPLMQTHVVATKSLKTAGKLGKPFRQAIYVQTHTFGVPANGHTGGTLKCPRRSVAVSGFWDTNGGIASDSNVIAPRGVRKWGIDMFDTTGAPGGKAIAGVVCLKF